MDDAFGVILTIVAVIVSIIGASKAKEKKKEESSRGAFEGRQRPIPQQRYDAPAARETVQTPSWTPVQTTVHTSESHSQYEQCEDHPAKKPITQSVNTAKPSRATANLPKQSHTGNVHAMRHNVQAAACVPKQTVNMPVPNFANKQAIVQAVIYSEVLGKPRSASLHSRR